MSEPTPFGRVNRNFTCPGLAMEQPDGVVPCYRAGHKCRTTWEELRDEHGIERRAFCGCCGDFQGAMGMPTAWITEERDRLRAAVDAALALHRPVENGTPDDGMCHVCFDSSWPCATVRALTDQEVSATGEPH